MPSLKLPPPLMLPTTAIHGPERVHFELHVLEERLCFARGIHAVGHIDGDGRNDIVAGGDSPRISWAQYPNLETTLTISAQANLGNEIRPADVDNDGDADVISSAAGTTWWENPLKPG